MEQIQIKHLQKIFAKSNHVINTALIHTVDSATFSRQAINVIK